VDRSEGQRTGDSSVSDPFNEPTGKTGERDEAGATESLEQDDEDSLARSPKPGWNPTSSSELGFRGGRGH